MGEVKAVGMDVRDTEEKLLCSVIVPVYNGVATILRCLDALAAQTAPAPSYEIIVVDDGSQDETALCVQRWIAHHPAVQARLVRQRNAGPAAARNHGASLARAPILLFTDADCAPTPTWVAAMLAAFADPAVAGAKGVYRSDQRGLTPRFVQAEYEDRYDRMRQLPAIDFIDTYSAGYRRLIFLAHGGFDSAFPTASVEDQEFSFRLARQGLRLVFTPEAQVFHLHDQSVGEYARRKYGIGYWKALVARRYPERIVRDSHTPQVLKFQIVLAALTCGAGVVGIAGRVAPALRRAWLLSGLCSLSFLASTLPFLAKVGRRSPALAVAGLFFLVVRSLALGVGFLAGALDSAFGRSLRSSARMTTAGLEPTTLNRQNHSIAETGQVDAQSWPE
jgi:GT2 family glycosyltransferase